MGRRKYSAPFLFCSLSCRLHPVPYIGTKCYPVTKLLAVSLRNDVGQGLHSLQACLPGFYESFETFNFYVQNNPSSPLPAAACTIHDDIYKAAAGPGSTTEARQPQPVVQPARFRVE